MKPRQIKFVVTVTTDLPWREVADYITDAVETWGGQYSGNLDAPDPRFVLKNCKWRVGRLIYRTKPDG